MREILFRGKRIDNGKWVYGYYVYTKDSNGEYQHFIVTPKWFIVYPSTVGQFAGLTDKNGKRIFEGDVVKISFAVSPMYGVVVFKNGGFYIKTAELGLLDLCATGSSRKIEVIGNIRDNPELMEVGE